MGSDTRKRDRRVGVRLTEDEEKELTRLAAKASAPSIAAYLRHCALNNGEVVSKADIEASKALIELGAAVSKVGGLLALHVKIREHRDSTTSLKVVGDEIIKLRDLRNSIIEALPKIRK